MRREALTLVGILFAAVLLMATFRAINYEGSEKFVRRGMRCTLNGLQDTTTKIKVQLIFLQSYQVD